MMANKKEFYMEELKMKAKMIGLKHAEGLLKEVAVELVFPALKEVVAKSETKIDDAVLMAMEEPLKQTLLAMIDSIYKEV